MPRITKYNRDYDFKFEWTNGTEETKATGRIIWCFYLQDNVCVRIKEDLESKDRVVEQGAIRESKEYGLQYWYTKHNYWRPYNEDIQKAYSDHIAEKEILEK